MSEGSICSEEVSKPMQAGIDSSQDVAMEICEASDSDCCRTKRKRVEKNHVSRVQSQADSSHGQLDGDLETHQVKHKRVKKTSDLELLLNYHGRTRISFELEYAKIALDFYEKIQDAKFEILELLFSNRATLVVPGFKGAGPWCHVSFIAKPKNSDCCGKHFFGEMVFDHASEKYNVTFCSIFEPSDPGNVPGCVFCPDSEIFLHPPHGCPAGGREIDQFMVQNGTDASQGQVRGCSKRHREWPKQYLIDRDADEMLSKRTTALEFKYAKIALEFFEKGKESKFEIQEARHSSKRVVVPGSKNSEECCHVVFYCKLKNTDCTKRYFFGELLRDPTTGKYSVTHCSILRKSSNWKADHNCIICPKDWEHPMKGYRVGRWPYRIEEESYLDDLQLDMNLRIQ